MEYAMAHYQVEQDGATLFVFEFYDEASTEAKFEEILPQDINWRYRAGFIIAMGIIDMLPNLSSTSHAYILTDENYLQAVVGFHPAVTEEDHNLIMEAFEATQEEFS